MVKFQLVSLTGIKFDEDVYEVVLPTLDGEIGVMTDHMPLVSVATVGLVSVRRDAKDSDASMEQFAISGGVIEVERNVLRLLVDDADNAADINESEAQKAYEAALHLKEQAKDQVSLEHAQAMVDRSAVRLHVAGLKRRHLKQ